MQQHCERSHSLRAVDQDTFNVGSGRRPCMERSIARHMEFLTPIGVLSACRNVLGIEQNDEVLGKVGERVYVQFFLSEEHRAGLGYAETCAHDGDIDGGEVPWSCGGSQVVAAAHLRYCGAHNRGGCQARP